MIDTEISIQWHAFKGVEEGFAATVTSRFCKGMGPFTSRISLLLTHTTVPVYALHSLKSQLLPYLL